MKPKKEIVVKQDLEKPIPTEIIAKSITDIANGMKAINEGRLNSRALRILIHDETNVKLYEIDRILRCLSELKSLYLRR